MELIVWVVGDAFVCKMLCDRSGRGLLDQEPWSEPKEEDGPASESGRLEFLLYRSLRRGRVVEAKSDIFLLEIGILIAREPGGGLDESAIRMSIEETFASGKRRVEDRERENENSDGSDGERANNRGKDQVVVRW